MAIAIICTGTELLKGGTLNTDLAFIGSRLCAAGIPPQLEISVGDDPGQLCAAIGEALRSADTLVISGGLGPTTDDITLDCVARFFGWELSEVPELRTKVENHWKLRHAGHCPKMQYRQARVPQGGNYFENSQGVAPGIECSALYGNRNRRIFLLPGPPNEFEAMAENMLIPRLKELETEKLYTSGFLLVGIGETQAARILEPLFAGRAEKLAYTAQPCGVRIYLSSTDENSLAPAIELAREPFALRALPAGEFELAAYLLKILQNRALSLGCAESCTGGKIADAFVTQPGASAIYYGGIVSYANEIKIKLLNVPENVLQSVGAVSTQCAEAMVRGCQKALGCRCALSSTGIAGPDGGTAEKPVGLVYIGCAVDDTVTIRELHLHGSRRTIRERATAAALQLLYETVNGIETEAKKC